MENIYTDLQTVVTNKNSLSNFLKFLWCIFVKLAVYSRERVIEKCFYELLYKYMYM